MFEVEKNKKIKRRKEQQDYEKNIEEQKILEMEKQIKANQAFIKGVVDRMNDDVLKRKLGIDKKCNKNEKKNNPNFTAKEENDENNIHSFKNKKYNNNYIFTVNKK